MKVIWLYYLLLINLYKLLSGYLYFANNLKDVKSHIGLHANLQNLFSN